MCSTRWTHFIKKKHLCQQQDAAIYAGDTALSSENLDARVFAGDEICRRVADVAAKVYQCARTLTAGVTAPGQVEGRANICRRPMIAELNSDGTALFEVESSSSWHPAGLRDALCVYLHPKRRRVVSRVMYWTA